jgi:hypothetical protein
MKLYISAATLRAIEKYGHADLTHIATRPSDHMDVELAIVLAASPVADSQDERAAVQAGISADRNFIAGVKLGWNFCDAGDEKGFQACIEGRMKQISEARAASPATATRKGGDDPTDTERLDWLERTNKPFNMGWRVGIAPAGNLRIESVIQLGSAVTPIRDAIDAARNQSTGEAAS